MAKTTRKTARTLSLYDRLSRLTYDDACKLLGPSGKRLIMEGGKLEIDAPAQVELTPAAFRLRLPGANGKQGVVTVQLDKRRRLGLTVQCRGAHEPAIARGAALSFILQEKVYLGLAAEPDQNQPFELLDEAQLLERALRERAQRAEEEPMDIEASTAKTPWTDYIVTSRLSGKTYRVALRGMERGDSFCSCGDFRKNTLGTCKHLMKVQSRVRETFSARRLKRPYLQKEYAVAVRYIEKPALRLLAPEKASGSLATTAAGLTGRDLDGSEGIHALLDFLAKAQKAQTDVRIYPDAEEFLEQFLHRERLASLVTEIRRDPAKHPLRTGLLHADLLPYQLDGIAFVAGAGRAILADDMGLGKTIQGIGVAELLRREAGIQKALIVCPASLKSQWAREIERFSSLHGQQIAGLAAERASQYANECFFTICNYEQVLRDLPAIERTQWDLIVLDEGQRIKNWEAKTSRAMKALHSRFALVLTGTPLENRLDDLYSVVEFLDGHRLGPAFRFFHTHRVVDEKGKVVGYKNLDQVREQLRPILLRRTRTLVQKELPPRTTEVVRVVPTDEQVGLHSGGMQVVRSIVGKPFLTEIDVLRLRQALLRCRLAANSSQLVDKEGPNHSTKLEKLGELLEDLAAEEDRKIILFSEWTGMLDLVEPILKKAGMGFVRLEGKVPQRKRQQLVDTFQRDPMCKAFLLTNAGATGLNLQAANTVINLDLPWNPAVLEQRIARAHRMGQKRPVQIFLLVSEGTIEENLLTSLSAKKELALATLDVSSKVTKIEIESNLEEMKRRLEKLLGEKPDAPLDESMQTNERDTVTQTREEIASSAGQLLAAAVQMAGALGATGQGKAGASTGPSDEMVDVFRDRLGQCIKTAPDGSQRLTVTLPGPDTLDLFARTFAQFAAMGGNGNTSSGDRTD